MTKTRNLTVPGVDLTTASAASTKSKLLELVDKYTVSEEQRRVILDASTKPLAYQQWFYNQFTRNR